MNTVKIFGIDFTSAPSRRKPITCAETQFDGTVLRMLDLKRWTNFSEFEAALQSPGRWVAAIDFPFGLPSKFVKNIGWPFDWAEYVECKVAKMCRSTFRERLEDYKRHRADGDKHHKRLCDVRSESQSPQTLYGTPVGLMFFEGARRLLEAGVHLPFNNDGDRDRIVLEAYPGVAVRQLLDRRSYKHDSKNKQTDSQLNARRRILANLRGEPGGSIYGFNVEAPDGITNDPGGDELDALLCAVQGAWGWMHRTNRFGAPADLERVEGWIADPSLASAPE